MNRNSHPLKRWTEPANLTGAALLVLLLTVWIGISARPPDVADWSVWLVAALPLVIAAIAQSQVVLVGGQGLAAGSTALFVNALVVHGVAGGEASILAWCVAGVLIGGAIGAANGLLIGPGRLPSSAVTIATAFIVGGLALALASLGEKTVPASLGALTSGSVLSLPAPFVLLLVFLLAAVYLDLSRLGSRIRRVGEGALEGSTRGFLVFLAYLMAGVGYGISGVILAASLGVAEPTTSGASLLDIYAAVALGGSIPHLRHGSVVGAALGALAITAVATLSISLELPYYAAPSISALLLLAGVYLCRRELAPWSRTESSIAASGATGAILVCICLPFVALFALGFGNALTQMEPHAILVSAMLALAVGCVLVTGTVDLSLPAVIAFSAIAAAQFTQGSASALLWAAPLILLVGGAVGAANSLLGEWLGASRIVISLASSGVLYTATIALDTLLPRGFAPLILQSNFLNAPIGTSAVAALVCLAPIASIGWVATPRGRAWLGRLSGAHNLAPRTTVHAAAGAIAAGVGIMMPGYAGQPPLSPADPFLLPALLAAQLAGLTIGRRGGNLSLLALSIPAVIVIEVILIGVGLTYPLRMSAMAVMLVGSIFLSRPTVQRTERMLGWPAAGESTSLVETPSPPKGSAQR